MVPPDCAVSHAILAEFVLQLLDLRLGERAQPPERAMPHDGGCRKFAKPSPKPRTGATREATPNFGSRRAGGAARARIGGVRRGGDAHPGRSGRMAASAARPRGAGARTGRRARTRAIETARWRSGTIEAAPGARRTAARHPRQPNHHPERFVYRLGVAKHSRYIGIQRDGSVSARAPADARRKAARVQTRARGGRSARWYGSARLKSRGFALAAPNLRSIAARARGPLRVPAGESRSTTRSLPRFLSSKRFIIPKPLSSGRAIHAAGSCRRCLRQVRTELDVLRLLVAG